MRIRGAISVSPPVFYSALLAPSSDVATYSYIIITYLICFCALFFQVDLAHQQLQIHGSQASGGTMLPSAAWRDRCALILGKKVSV
jgi:hypothetical protein